ncbi:hypothetical protein Tco_0870488 [Tanacetum coccineum]
MSDKPLGDDSKPISYDVPFSNPLFDFNDDFTLCNDNLLFDEEFEDVNINLLLGEHLDTLSTEDREIDFSPSRDIEELERSLADDPFPDQLRLGDILYFEQLLNEDTSSYVSPALLPTESSSLDLPLSDPKQICLNRLKGGGNNNKNYGLIKVYCLLSVRSRCGSLQKKARSDNNLRLINFYCILSVRTPDVAAFKKVEEIYEVEIRLLALVG